MRSRHRSKKLQNKSAVKHIVLSHPSLEESDPRTAQAEQYFNEIADMINKPVNDLVYQPDEPVPQSLLDEVLGMIPPNELPPDNHRYDDYTEEQVMREIDALNDDLEKLSFMDKARKFYDSLEVSSPTYIQEQLKERIGLEAQNKRDTLRIEGHLHIIASLVKQLSSWSSTRKGYQKIIQNQLLSPHEKIQGLMAAAQLNFETCRKNRKVFFIRHFSEKASNIHAAIANIDIHSQPVQISQPDQTDSPTKR